MKVTALIIILLYSVTFFGQSDTLNQFDEKGLKQGYWIIYGKDYPDKGFCDTCKIEEGTYLNDRRNGFWIRYYQEPNIPRLKGIYKNGRPYGEYERYDKEGHQIPKNSYRILKEPYQNINECGKLDNRLNFNSQGQLEGWQYYFYNSCNCPDTSINVIEFAVKKKEGVSIDTAYRYYKNGCLRDVIIFSNDGSILSTKSYENTCEVDSNSVYIKCVQQDIVSVTRGPKGLPFLV